MMYIAAILCLAAVTVAVPVSVPALDVDASGDGRLENLPAGLQSSDVIDITELVEELEQLHDSATDVIGRVEATLLALQSMAHHSIRKRDTSIDGSIERGPGGATGRIDVNHRRGNTDYNANVSRGPGGTTWGAGVSHKSGNSQFGANVSRGRHGTRTDINYGRSWNNGRTRLDAYGSRDRFSGTSGGIRFSHRF